VDESYVNNIINQLKIGTIFSITINDNDVEQFFKVIVMTRDENNYSCILKPQQKDNNNNYIDIEPNVNNNLMKFLNNVSLQGFIENLASVNIMQQQQQQQQQ